MAVVALAVLLLSLGALCFGGRELAHASVWGGVSLNEGEIHWLGHEKMCLEVEGISLMSAVQAQPCRLNATSMHFTFPGRSGMIRLQADPTLCIAPLHRRAQIGERLVLDTCNETVEEMQWEMPSEANGQIRLLHNRLLCVEQLTDHLAHLGACPLSEQAGDLSSWHAERAHVSGEFKFSGEWCLSGGSSVAEGPVFMSGDCESDSPSTRFRFIPGRSGPIRFAANQHLCMKLLPDTMVHLQPCGEALDPDMLWQVPEVRGPIRLAREPSLCILGIAGAGTPVMTYRCSESVPEAMHFDVVEKMRNLASPSLFCVSVVQSTGYEREILSLLLKQGQERLRNFGIFDCNDFRVYNSGPQFQLGWHPDVGLVKTTGFDGAPVGISQDGTAGNALLFMNMWGAVRWEGKYKDYDWVVKADTDTVFLPSRLRELLRPMTSDSAVYIPNCNDHPNAYEYPMLFGALEVFSQAAIGQYFSHFGDCSSLNWGQWGEDYFMKKCMESLGVRGDYQESLVADSKCHSDANCTEWHPAYHPFKDKQSWLSCLDTAQETL